jgi:hypothetical protein
MPGGDSVVAVPNAWVTLHRVAPDSAGPLDSMRTDAAGRYVFSYAHSDLDDAVYFVSSSYGGIAYFTRPLHAGVDSGYDAEVAVFDTTSRAVPVTVRGRHVIVSRPDADGVRTVTEVFDLSNDSSVTRIARGDAANNAVWASLLPSHAMRPTVSDGDIPAAAVRFDGERALVFAPFAPGMKQFVYEYGVAEGNFPLAIPTERATSVLEVLLEEPGATVDAPSLRQMPPVAVQGRTFRRFLAQDVPANAVITIGVPDSRSPPTAWFAAGLTLVIGGAMTWALARALRRR